MKNTSESWGAKEERAYRLFLHYASMAGIKQRPEEDSIASLLTDIMHLCASYGEDFQRCAELAKEQYVNDLRD